MCVQPTKSRQLHWKETLKRPKTKCTGETSQSRHNPQHTTHQQKHPETNRSKNTADTSQKTDGQQKPTSHTRTRQTGQQHVSLSFYPRDKNKLVQPKRKTWRFLMEAQNNLYCGHGQVSGPPAVGSILSTACGVRLMRLDAQLDLTKITKRKRANLQTWNQNLNTWYEMDWNGLHGHDAECCCHRASSRGISNTKPPLQTCQWKNVSTEDIRNSGRTCL